MSEYDAIIRRLRGEMARYDKPENKMDLQRFFKEKLKLRYILKSAIIKKISSEVYQEAESLSRKELFQMCEILLKSGHPVETWIAFGWANRRKEEFQKGDFAVFESWVKKYVDGWASCDSLCCGALGELIVLFPDLTKKTVKWADSESTWLKRAAAVALIPSLKKGRQLETAFFVADRLLTDSEDMVQKGYGWMLKVAADTYQKEVFAYVMEHKEAMPRTALRYAIEKMPSSLKKKAMR